MRVLAIGIGSEVSVRIMDEEQYTAYSVSPTIPEKILFSFGFTEHGDVESLRYLADLLRKDEKLRAGVACLLSAMFGRTRFWTKNRIKEIAREALKQL